MIFSYLPRLLCLCFASFFLIHAALSLAAWATAPAAIRLGESMKPRFAARLLFALRILPLALAAFVVSTLCVPSYLWFEPRADAERVGIACFVAALLGAVIWAMSVARVARALSISLRHRRQWERAARETLVAGEAVPVFVVESERPLLALAGVVRPRIVVSRGVLDALSQDQIDAAIEHERAHRTSRDNLKRLLLLLAPNVFPFSRGFAALDRGWARFSEWAADDRAAAGNSRRSLSLAAALVRVSRLGVAARSSLFASSLIEDGRDLCIRVDRLLAFDPPAENPRRGTRALLASAALALAGLLAAAITRPETLYAVHRLLEHLIR